MKDLINKLKFKTSQEGIDFINNKVKIDEDFSQLLLASLHAAKSKAFDVNSTEALDKYLREILTWPTSIAEYDDFLVEFARWIPQQSPNPAWRDAEGHSQEVYDRLCHFYYLIDQPVGAGGTKIVQNIDWFSEWLIAYANVWGYFLDTTESFNEKILDSFIKYSPYYRVEEDSMINGKPNDPNGWNTFNEFFSRELNPGIRPICKPNDNTVVTMPADCTYRMQYKISDKSEIDKIYVKKTHSYGKISELLDDSVYGNSFKNGTFVHYFLGPYSYHRFHTPVAGAVMESRAVQGLTYLEVNLNKNQFHAPDNAENGYEFTQARGIIVIDTKGSPYGDVGLVAIIPVGMCQVSSVHMTLDADADKQIEKGKEFGFFRFGGSDIIMLFQEGHKPNINTCSNYRYYGGDMSICPKNDPK